MDKQEALNRLNQIIVVWENSLKGMPPEVAAERTTMVILRQPDIQAMRETFLWVTKIQVLTDDNKRLLAVINKLGINHEK